MPVPPAITTLIEKYRASSSGSMEGGISRQSLCRDFIDPFLECLGWERQSGDGPGQKSRLLLGVPVRISGQAGYIDYILCSGKGYTLAIMVTDCSLEDECALLLMRYAWNAGIDLAILTNFHESALYNTTIPVRCSDDVAGARITTISVDQFEEYWDRIGALLSRECMTHDSIGLFLRERGIMETSRIGQVLLQDLEAWRVLLAKKIVLHNHGLTEEILNEVVHSLLVRILLLRIIEDKGLGQEGVLMRVTGGGSAYGRLCGLFRYAEEVYGTGLFQSSERAGRLESTGSLIFSLSVDDDTIRTIISGLSSGESPYEFSIIPARVLARVFSTFLGKVIRIWNGHQAFIEERPEKRKSGDPNPIPCWIAEYMVRRTLSELVEGKTPRDLRHLHILDPACGSGLFLLTAFEFLIEWHRNWYFRNLLPVPHRGDFSSDDIRHFLPEEADQGAALILPFVLVQEMEGASLGKQLTVRLVPEERIRILLSFASGVDIDRRAVEITRFLLLVAVMGEGQEVVFPLPDLASCIRCGNSVVGPDFLDDPDTSLIDPGARERINAFDWAAAFPHVVGSGGFDGIIGCFPDHRSDSLKGEKAYLEKHYRCHHQNGALYPCFVEKGMLLLKQGGFLSAAFPDTWLRSEHGSRLRLFLSETGIQEIIVTAHQGRERPSIPRTCIVTVAKKEPGRSLSVVQGMIPDNGDFAEYLNNNRYTIPQSRIRQGIWNLADTSARDLAGKIQKAGTPLEEYVMGAVYRGIGLGIHSPRIIDSMIKKRLIAEDPGSSAIIRPFFCREELKRYHSPSSQFYVITAPSGAIKEEYPAVYRQLRNQMKALKKKRGVGKWACNQTMRDEGFLSLHSGKEQHSDLIARPKIAFPCVAKEGRFTLDSTGHYLPDTCCMILSTSLYLLGLLNSRLIWFYIGQILPPLRGGYRRLWGPLFEKIPIYVPDFENRDDANWSDMIEALVRQMITLHGEMAEMEDPTKKAVYLKQIRELDHTLDHLVYEIYRLTPDEVRIIEKATSGPEPPS